MARVSLITTQKQPTTSVLIIDEAGDVGNHLAMILKEEFLPTLVSPTPPTSEGIAYIRYKNRLPKIPENAYSHIFIISDTQKIISRLLGAFFIKDQFRHSRIFLLVSLAVLSPTQLEKLQAAYPKILIGVMGDVFGETMLVSPVQDIVTLFKEAGEIVIPNDGLMRVYPVSLKSLLAGIIRVAFATTRTSNAIIYFFSSSPLPLFSFAREIKSVHPLSPFRFKKNKISKRNIQFSKSGTYYFSEKAAYIDELKSLSPGNEKQKKEKVVRPSSEKKKLVIISKKLFQIVSMVVLLPLVVCILIWALGLGLLYFAREDLLAGKYQSAVSKSQVARVAFNTTSQVDLIVTYPLQALGGGVVATRIKDYEEIGGLVSDTLFYASKTGQKVEYITQSQKAVTISDGQELSYLSQMNLSLLTQLSLKENLPDRIRKEVKDGLDSVRALSPFLDNITTIGGFSSPKTYLLLFHNNMELRPGGGFIGSIGKLTYERGRVNNFIIYDVYDLDGKLKGHIEPPFWLRRYLGVSHLFLRDSNTDISFAKNAENATTLYELETGESVDGVIGIDVNFLQKLLFATGPLTLPDEKEPVTENNFFSLAEAHQDKFFPGSTQKKDFLSSVATVLEQKLLKGEVSQRKLLNSIVSALSQKHIQVSFLDSSLQTEMVLNNYSPSLWDPRTSTTTTLNDYFGIVEANTGANKANYFIKKEIEQKVEMTENLHVKAEANITYTNTSKKTTTLEGDYKNYLQIILPKNAVLSGIKINGVSQVTIPAITNVSSFTDQAFVPSQEFEIDRREIEGKTIYGMYLEVARQQTKTLTISYEIPTVLDPKSGEVTYSLKYFKQPGVGEEDMYHFTLLAPEGYKVGENSNAYEWEGKLEKDMELKTTLIKK